MNQVEQRAEFHMSWLQKAGRTAFPLRAALGLGIGVASSGAALLVDHHFNNTSIIVEAADPNCRVGVRFESYQFFDMAQFKPKDEKSPEFKVLPEWGREHILDMNIDPIAGPAAGFTVDAVPVTYKRGERNTPSYKPYGSTNIEKITDPKVGKGEIRLTVPCNTTTVNHDGKTMPALRFKVVTSLDPNNDQYEVVVAHEDRVPVYIGSEIKKAEDFLNIVNAGVVQIRNLDDNKKSVISQAVKAKDNLTVQDPKADEIRRNIEQKGNPKEDPYKYEITILGAIRRVLDWKF